MITREGRGPCMAGMMGIVLGAALGFSAIRTPTTLGSQTVAIASVAALIVAALGAVLCEPKPFWFGFASVGWASMALSAEFWIDDGPGCPWLLGAAGWRWLDGDGYGDAVRRYSFGFTQFRMAILCQIAVAQGVLGGLLAALLTRIGRPTPIVRRLADWRPVVLGAILALASTVLALRFCRLLVAESYVLLVSTALITATLGCFVGAYRMACRWAAILGWLTLGSQVTDRRETRHGPENLPVGVIEGLYSRLYPETIDPPELAEYDASSRAAWKTWILGEHVHDRWLQNLGRWPNSSPGWGWWQTPQYLRFARVVQHAAGLAAMMFGAIIGARLDAARRNARASL